MGINAIVSSSGRKGTFMLLTALQRHPAVFVHDQVFSSRPDFVMGASGAEAFHQCFDREFLEIPPETVVVLPASPTMESSHGNFPGFWEAAAAAPDTRVLHLRRRNMLRWRVSLLVAGQTGSWSSKYRRSTPEPAVAVDPDEAAEAIFWDLHYERENIERFSSHPSLELFYEDFAADAPSALLDAQTFLGLEPLPLCPVTRKQSTRPLVDSIVNYGELAALWRGTQYAGYLDPA